jgi:hypothetical protein
MDAGLTRDAALASVLDEAIESSIRVYLSMVANGHLTPHAEDRLAGDRATEF